MIRPSILDCIRSLCVAATQYNILEERDSINRRTESKGDPARVDEFLDARGLRKSEVFPSVVQAVLEMAAPGSGERSTLEKIQNHLGRGRPSGRVREATLWHRPT